MKATQQRGWHALSLQRQEPVKRLQPDNGGPDIDRCPPIND